jgi:hypothetical protein
MVIPQCQHTMPDGHQCGSPALKSQSHCYFHNPNREPRIRKPRTRYPNFNLEALPNIDTPEEIHQSLSTVLQGLAANTISLYQAQTMIYGLQLASNLTR